MDAQHAFAALSALTRPALAHPGLCALALVLLLLARRTFLERRRAVAPPALRGWAAHRAEAARVAAEFRAWRAERAPGTTASIKRSRGGEADSNRTIASDYKAQSRRVDVSALDGVIAIDRARGLMHIEPGMSMDEMARVGVAHGVLPLVVLEFPGITAGGAVSGGGIESSSHKYGSFFDTVEEVDCVAGDGRFLERVSRTHEPELFHALSASYGTHAILTRIAVRVAPAPRFVHVRYVHCDGMPAATLCMERLANAPPAAGGGGGHGHGIGIGGFGAGAPEFIDGVAMAADSAVVVVGEGCDALPAGVPLVTLRANRSDPWFFWHLATIARAAPAVSQAQVEAAAPAAGGAGAEASLARLAGHAEVMPLEDYLFRFDRGAFWMARHGLAVFYGSGAWGADLRAPAGPAWVLRVKYAWLATTRQLYCMLHKIGDEGLARTYVVQDLVMPDRAAACALADFTGDASPDAAGAGEGCLAIWPLWVCPVRVVAPRHAADAGFGFPVQAPQARAGGMFFNVGVYGLPNGGRAFDPVALNRALERRATQLGGRKMLYAQSFYSEAEFWQLFDRAAYERARKRYGGEDAFAGIARKLLLGDARMAAMRGRKEVSFAPVLAPMALWYLSLWGELLLPRAAHAAFGIHHTGMTYYDAALAAAPQGEEAAAAEEGGGAGAEAAAQAQAPTPRRRGRPPSKGPKARA